VDVLHHLTEEHRKVEGLLDQLADTEPGEERDDLVEQLEHSLGVHMAVEEHFVYPIVEDVAGAEARQEELAEHDLTRTGLAQLRELIDGPGFGAVVAMLQGGIGHHVEEEETELFPQLREEAADRIAELDAEELERRVEEEGLVDLVGGMATGDATVDLGGDDDGPTKAELMDRAREVDLPGRSQMTKDELAEALADQTLRR
jgi:iron-sulfur cluster repair protein YtfE (RIC family)